MSTMNFDRLLESYRWKFSFPVSLLVEPLVLFGYCLPRTCLFAMLVMFIAVGTRKGWCGWGRRGRLYQLGCQEVAKHHEQPHREGARC